MVQSGFEFLISCLCLPNAGVPGACHCDCLLLLGVPTPERVLSQRREEACGVVWGTGFIKSLGASLEPGLSG